MDRIADQNTILNLRHLLEKHNIQEKILATVNKYLRTQGILVNNRKIVDATIVKASRSTKNKNKQRALAMSSVANNICCLFSIVGNVLLNRNKINFNYSTACCL